MWSSAAWHEHQRYILGPDAQWAIGQLRQRGVTYDAMLAAYMPGGTRIRVPNKGFWRPDENGKPAVLLPVVAGILMHENGIDREPIVADILAFDPAKPTEWGLRYNEFGTALGGDNLERCGRHGMADFEITLYPDPLSWLLAGARGAVLLQGRECRNLILDVPRLNCSTVTLGRMVSQIIVHGDLGWPEVRVPG
ncbi:MAG: hypothetical protein VW338_00115 [Rhodospirillaceae bacterium]